jgi:DNA-binding protein Fis
MSSLKHYLFTFYVIFCFYSSVSVNDIPFSSHNPSYFFPNDGRYYGNCFLLVLSQLPCVPVYLVMAVCAAGFVRSATKVGCYNNTLKKNCKQF